MNVNNSILPVIFGLTIGAFGLSGCDSTREVIGLVKQAPDEFAVVTSAPLSIPPQFGLRPPKPGAPRPQETTPNDNARGILLPKSLRKGKFDAGSSRNLTTGEVAFLRRADSLNVDPSIRQKINVDSGALVETNQSFLRKIMFWQKSDSLGKIVDSEKESKRIRQVTSQGDAVTKGETPVIIRKQKGWLEGIF
jgi:hypothetical protein